MDLGRKVKERREELGLSQDEVATRMGYKSRSSVNKIEAGRPVSQKIIKKLAKALNVSEPYLMGFEDTPEPYSAPAGIMPLPDLSGLNKIPVLGTIACGSPITANQEYDYIEIDEMIKADFCVRADGESMIDAGIRSGSIVLCRYTEQVENGQIAAVSIDDDVTLKKFYSYGDTVVLRPCNPDFPEQVYTKDELNHIHIIGKAVTCISSIN